MWLTMWLSIGSQKNTRLSKKQEANKWTNCHFLTLLPLTNILMSIQVCFFVNFLILFRISFKWAPASLRPKKFVFHTRNVHLNNCWWLKWTEMFLFHRVFAANTTLPELAKEWSLLWKRTLAHQHGPASASFIECGVWPLCSCSAHSSSGTLKVTCWSQVEKKD